MQSAILNCFCQCGYGLELNTEVDSGSSIEEEDDAFHKDWIWLGAEKDVDFSFYISVDNDLAMCGVTSIDELCDDREGGGSGEEEGDECEPEPVPSFTEAHTAFKTVKSFFYAHSIGEHDEQVILKLELVLFHLKCKVSTKQLLITDFFGKKVIFTQVTFYFFFIGPSVKFIIFICIILCIEELCAKEHACQKWKRIKPSH
jgi:hypothetical protein